MAAPKRGKRTAPKKTAKISTRQEQETQKPVEQDTPARTELEPKSFALLTQTPRSKIAAFQDIIDLQRGALEPAENTVPKQLTPWKPGQSGNPAGRPKGARSKLQTEFFADLHATWEEHGAAVMLWMVHNAPKDFVRVIATLMPKEMEIKKALDDIDPDDLGDFIAALTEVFDEKRRRDREGIIDITPGSAGARGEDALVPVRRVSEAG